VAFLQVKRGDHSPLDWGLPNSTAYPSAVVIRAGQLLANATTAAAAAAAAAVRAAAGDSSESGGGQQATALGVEMAVQRMMELQLEITYVALWRWAELQDYATKHSLRWPFG
jgi:hypothetical protein